MRTLLRSLGSIVAAVTAVAVGLVVLAAVLVATTTSGARFALERGAALVPGRIELGALEGSLVTRLVLEDLHYESETLTADLGRLIVEPELAALVSRRIVLNRVAAENGVLRLAEATPETDIEPQAEDAEPLPLPDLPQYVAVDTLRLDDVRVEGPGMALSIESASGSLADGALVVDGAELESREPVPVSASLAMRLTSRRITGSVTGSVALPDGMAPSDGPAPEDTEAVRTDDEAAAAENQAAPAAAADADRISLAAVFEIDADPAAGDGALRAAVEWTELAWPALDLRSPSGRLVATPRAAGGATAIELAARLDGEALPGPAELTSTATLTSDTLDLTTLDLETLGGTASVTGELALDTLSGRVELAFDGIDPSSFDERLEGRLEGRFDATLATEPALRVGAQGTLGGELGGRPLAGRFAGRYAEGALTIEQARVELEDGTIELDGSVAPETTRLSFSARLPALSSWYPPASGSISANGTIAGPTENPAVNAELEARNLGLEDASVPPLEMLSASVEGRLASHRLDLDALSELGRVSLMLEQGYADGLLSGTLQDSVLEPVRTGTWRLDAPAAYSIASADTLRLERACYVGPENGRLCAAAMDGVLAVDARALPNTLAEPWLPAGLAITGTTDLELSVALTGPLEGRVTIEQQSLSIGVESADAARNVAGATAADAAAHDGDAAARSRAETRAAADAGARRETADGAARAGPLAGSDFVSLLDLASLSLSATIGPEGLEAEIAGGPESLEETISGAVTLSPLSTQGRLDGRIVANVADISVIGAFVDGVEMLEGELEARVTLAGTPEAPEITGRIAVGALSAELPPLGIGITDGELEAEVDGLDEIRLEGELCSMGCAALTGRLAVPPDAPWHAELSIEGERVEVADLPDLRAVVTPELAVSATSEGVSVTGVIDVAEATIEVADLPRTAVRPAPETVVYGREPAAGEQAQALPLPLLVDVEATLGDVRFEGLGLTAELAGALEVEHTADARWLVQGQAEIEEGAFSAYGQTLTIEQGLLIFSGPADNPTLDIRATRIVEGVEVGLLITGPANNPSSEVFSAGGLSQSEAVARLLTGRSLENAGQSADPEALERAAVGLGIRRVLPALGRIGNALGLDELGVEAPGAEQGALVAGTQLGDDVYLRYKHGLFDDFSGLELIYRITEHFRLRTETGTAQAIDLVYEVQRGRAERNQDIEDVVERFDEPVASRSPADEVAPAD